MVRRRYISAASVKYAGHRLWRSALEATGMSMIKAGAAVVWLLITALSIPLAIAQQSRQPNANLLDELFEKYLPSRKKETAPPAPQGPYIWDAISITWDSKLVPGKKAILIANSAYKHVNRLSAPPHDVAAVASQLSQFGFQTTILQDPTSAQIVQAIETASSKGQRGSLLAVYYSGHAAAIDGDNSLLLTGYDPADSGSDQIILLKTILTLLASADFEKVLVAFDACRSLIDTDVPQPKASVHARAPGPIAVRGLARSDKDFSALNHKEYAVLFSTSHGEFAIDSTIDVISPFTKSFLMALGRETSFVPAMLLTKRVTEEVTGGAQSPDIQIKWNGDLTYAKSPSVMNSAVYVLNYEITAAEMAGATVDLSKITKSVHDADGHYTALGLNETVHDADKYTALTVEGDAFPDCQDQRYKFFFWYADILNIGQCYLPKLGYKSSDSSNLDPYRALFYWTEWPGGTGTDSGYYRRAIWKFDLDFDGSPETMDVRFVRAGPTLTVSSKTSQFEFGGTFGPGIEFVGLHDFNKDGVLDVYVYQSDTLIILDGKRIAKGLGTIKQCWIREAYSSDPICKRLAKVRSSISFLNNGLGDYSGHEILQMVLYVDWHIKHWFLGENGILHVTTRGPTWSYERNQPDNYGLEKLVSYNPATGRLNVSLRGKTDESLSTVPVAAQIAGVPDIAVKAR